MSKNNLSPYRASNLGKKAKSVMQQLEENYQLIFNSFPVGIGIADIEGNVLKSNPAMDHITGYSAKDWKTMQLKSMYVDPNERKHVLNTLQKDGEIHDWEIQLKRKDGTIYTALLNIDLIKIDGKPILLTNIRDITERKIAEKLIKKEKEKAQQYLDIAGVIIVALNKKGNITLINKRGCKVLGYREEEILGVNWFEKCLPPSYRKQVYSFFKKIVSDQEDEIIDCYENPILTKDGKERLILWHNVWIKDKNGKVIGSLSSGEDITERKKTEEELNVSKTLMMSTLESTVDGILVVDDKGAVIHYNTRFEKLWRIPRKLIEIRDDRKLLNFVLDQLKYPEAFLSKVQTLYRSPDDGFDTLRFKDGRIFERFSRPLIFDDRINGRVWSFRDVTERKETEEALAKQTVELKRSISDMEQYAYVASHDLKEPLRAITVFLQLIEQRCKNKFDIEDKKHFSRVIKNANRMRTLIDDLLAYAHVGRKGELWKKVDCSDILNQAIENLKFFIDDCRAVITYSPLPVVMGLETELLQLFQNLISNAIKFRGANRLNVHVSAEKKGSDWFFSVKDNGIGIDMKYVDQIFKLFKRLHNGDNIKGTGLGLAIAKKVVDNHGGRIWVDSKLGKGSTFYFTIPVNV